MSEINFGNPYTDITAESLEAAAEQRFPSSPPPSGAAPAEGESDPTPPQPPSSDPQPTFSLPDQFDFNGRPTTRAEVEAWAQFDTLLRDDPRLAELVYDHLRGTSRLSQGTGTGQGGGVTASAPPPPVYTPVNPPPPIPSGGWGSPAPSPGPVPTPSAPFPPQLPEGVDLSDPTTAFLWNTIQQQHGVISNFQQEINRHGSILSSRVESDAKTVIQTASDQFRNQYGLDDATMQQISQVAARLEVLPSVLRGIDPISGQPTDPNPLNAVTRALEVAAYSIPEVRNQLFSSQIQQNELDQRRKDKLGQLAGGGRGVPRQTPPPRNPAEARQAMIEEVSAAMFGNGQS